MNCTTGNDMASFLNNKFFQAFEILVPDDAYRADDISIAVLYDDKVVIVNDNGDGVILAPHNWNYFVYRIADALDENAKYIPQSKILSLETRTNDLLVTLELREDGVKFSDALGNSLHVPLATLEKFLEKSVLVDPILTVAFRQKSRLQRELEHKATR